MPTTDPIAAARREAKARARKGGTTHQQALDAIAREAGHANWSAMSAAPPPRHPVREFVERMRPHGGIEPNDQLKALAEDAINGYLAEEPGVDIADFVDRYEYRGDGFEIAPDAFQRDILENAIAGYMRELVGPDGDEGPKRGPNHFMPFLLDEFPHLKPPYEIAPEEMLAGGSVPIPESQMLKSARDLKPDDPQMLKSARDLKPDDPQLLRGAMDLHKPTLADVERYAKRIMERQSASGASGMTVSQWVSSRMREAANKGLADAGEPLTALAQLPMTTDTVAYAMDPDGGPYEDVTMVTVRCPLHGEHGGERNPSLVIAGMTMRCMAGCDPDALSSHLVERLCAAGQKARAFMKRNDRSPVQEGSSNSARGGMGGTYRLADGSTHRMETLACRLLPEGYPRWEYGVP